MKKSLLIVESPTKARTLSKYLGKEFTIKASKGHVKDLPESKLGVDVNHDFKAEYRIIPGKEKIIKELRKEANRAESIFLGPDPDREGEAIAWHIAEEISHNGAKGKDVYRVLFYELTQKGIKEALERPGKLNRHLYEAQQARRILDRLVGYLISPLLWQKVKRGLSAGRVQSVALRLVCERERKIQRFKPEEYWTVEAVFSKLDEKSSFSAKLFKLNGKKPEIKNKEQADSIVSEIKEFEVFKVHKVQQKQRRKNPSPPFITSTLQQEASRKLRFSPRKTMMIAQQLYEGVELPGEGAVGLITYMRTDSTRLSSESVEAARRFIAEKWGKEYLPVKSRQFKVKSSAQDAHEAIRPTDVFRTPEDIRSHLSRDQYALYELIWKRFVACQMKQAILLSTSIDVVPLNNEQIIFRATGSVVDFPGYMILYVEGSDDNGEEDSSILPKMEVNEELKLLELQGSQHFTQPPPRYTEASLIKELEQNGVGRPSTYATIVSTIQERGYVSLDKRTLKPTELGFVVNDILVKYFPEIINVSFTAEMERKLDEVERGNYSFIKLLHEFYSRFKPMLDDAQQNMQNFRVNGIPSGIDCPDCGKPLVIRWDQGGHSYLSCSECGFTSDYEREQDGSIKIVKADGVKDVCSRCGKPMVVRHGRFGPFLACSGYPKCKTTKPLGIGVPCPDDNCDGEIVERRSRKGRIFYGCSNYPKCSVIFSYRPTNKTCPECGYPVMLLKKTKKKGTELVCPNRECNYSQPLEQ